MKCLRQKSLALLVLAAVFAISGMAGSNPALAAPFFFSTGNPNNLIATASRPQNGSSFEIESADDFLLSQPTLINSITFTGLLTGTRTSPNRTIGQAIIPPPLDQL